MMTDNALLQQFVADRSAEALHQIIQRYAGMVYGVALRVTTNRAAAEDVVQDCFFKFTQKADQVRDSLPGWLYCAAMNRARELCRSEAIRRRHERAAAVTPGAEHEQDATWSEIAPHVDEALAALPEDLRLPLIKHFLCGSSQDEVARQLGVSQGTISRRIERGLEQVRQHLRHMGVATPPVGALATLMSAHSVQAVPSALMAALGRITLASGVATNTAKGLGAVTIAHKAMLAIFAVLVLVGVAAIPLTEIFGMKEPKEQSNRVLSNLRPMVNWNLGQNYQINGYLQFQMECLGESPEYDYWFFAGVGGDNHTQVFTADTSRFCHSLSHIDFGPEFASTLYDAVGYDFTYVTEEQFNADRPRYTAELAKCIDRGIPVIARETASSTRSQVQEFALLVGYEDNGGELLFVEGDSIKPFKVPTNRHVSFLFIIPGDKKQAPPLAEVYRNAVMNIPTLLTRPQKGDVSFGRNAFEAWADHLLTQNYAGWTDEQLDLWRLHTTYVCIVATNGSDRHFLNRAARVCPDLPFIADVEKQYAEMGRLWKDEMDATGGSFNMTRQTLRDPEARQRISNFIRRYTDCCDSIIEIYRAHGYPSIQTARLVVRPFTPDDWKGLQHLAIDKKNTGGDRYDHAWPTDDKGAQEMAQWCVGQRCFAVCLKDGGQLIGFVRFNSIDDNGQLDLGHMFHSRYRGEGYASEAIQPLLAVAFADTKVSGIVARNAVDWSGQLTPLVELGFRELERNQAPNFDGTEGAFAACLMGLPRSEWPSQAPAQQAAPAR